MSTILKALRKLEEDRSASSRRPLREEVASAGTRRTRSRVGWLLLFSALGAGIAAGAGALAFFAASREEPPAAESAPALAGAPAEAARPAGVARARRAGGRVANAEPRRASRGAAAPEAPQRAAPALAADAADAPPAALGAELPDEALASAVQVVRRPAPEPRIAAPEPGEVLVPEPDEFLAPAPERPAPAPPLTARAELEPAPARDVPAPPSTSPARETQVEAEESAPAPRTLARAVLPSLRVAQTRWHPDAARRTALVEVEAGAGVREVREGDALGPVVVTAIEPSGVVFSHEGIELRRRVGEP
jgi:hypothetical protein